MILKKKTVGVRGARARRAPWIRWCEADSGVVIVPTCPAPCYSSSPPDKPVWLSKLVVEKCLLTRPENNNLHQLFNIRTQKRYTVSVLVTAINTEPYPLSFQKAYQPLLPFPFGDEL